MSTHVHRGPALPPSSVASVLEALDLHLAAMPEREAIVFPESGLRMSWRDLSESSMRAAASLREAGVKPGDLVGVMLRNDERFVPAVLGAWRLRATAVPMPIPGAFADVDVYGEHIRAMIAAAGVRHVIHDPSLAGEHTEAAIRRLEGVTWVDSAARFDDGATESPEELPSPSDLALVQYTSGSTSAPRGVELTHANLTAGIDAFGIATALGRDDRWAVWTPLFHDFGLISTITALSFGAAVWMWSPMRFMRNPGGWLADFGRAGITHYSGPNFSFDLMLASATDEDFEGVSFDSWRVAVSGGESVSAATVRRFIERFEQYGFRAETMVPGYGLAEATLAVTVPAIGATPRFVTMSRQGLTERRTAEPVATEDPDARPLVSVGHPVPGIAVRIVDEPGTPLRDGEVGEIEVSGPSITRGYRGHPDGAEQGWFGTGDLGFMDKGELFIVGRIKDVVNVRGTKYHPEDLEPIVAEVEGVRKGRCCVVGVGETHERMAVIAETRVQGDELTRLRNAIHERLLRRLGISDILVYLVEPRTVQVTSSGKLRRQLMRRLLESGKLVDLESAPVPEGAPA